MHSPTLYQFFAPITRVAGWYIVGVVVQTRARRRMPVKRRRMKMLMIMMLMMRKMFSITIPKNTSPSSRRFHPYSAFAVE